MSNNKKTSFIAKSESILYLEALGATKCKDEMKWVYGDLIFTLDTEYRSLYCESEIYGDRVIELNNEEIIAKNNLDRYINSIDTTFNYSHDLYGNHIMNVEDLVYVIGKIYHNNDLEKYYYDKLEEIKVKVLQKTLCSLNKINLQEMKAPKELHDYLTFFLNIINMERKSELKNFINKYNFHTVRIREKNSNDCIYELYFCPIENENQKFEFKILDENSYAFITLMDNAWILYYNLNGKSYLNYSPKDYDKKAITYDLNNNLVTYSNLFNNPKWQTPSNEEKQFLSNIYSNLNEHVKSLNNKMFEEDNNKAIEKICDYLKKHNTNNLMSDYLLTYLKDNGYLFEFTDDYRGTYKISNPDNTETFFHTYTIMDGHEYSFELRDNDERKACFNYQLNFNLDSYDIEGILFDEYDGVYLIRTSNEDVIIDYYQNKKALNILKNKETQFSYVDLKGIPTLNHKIIKANSTLEERQQIFSELVYNTITEGSKYFENRFNQKKKNSKFMRLLKRKYN